MIAFSKLGNYGRLGNQLFQYAYLREMARRLGVPFYCPTWDGDQIFDLHDEAERAPGPVGIVHAYDPDPEAGFAPEALEIRDGTEIQGYFQSERFYSDPDLVRRWYTFKPAIVDAVRARFPDAPFVESASVSLRLDSDYASTRDYFPLYPRSYYAKALETLDLPGPVIVFADRPDMAREFLRPLAGREYRYVEGLTGPQQLYLMTQCKANVITNSTFAWWGAFLNAVSGGRVVAPTHWTRPGIPIPIRDVLCESWIKVPGTVPIWDHLNVWRVRHPVRFAQRIALRISHRLGLVPKTP